MISDVTQYEQDEWGNSCTASSIDGNIDVTVLSKSGSVPVLTEYSIEMINGRASITLNIQENSPGEDGVYQISFQLRDHPEIQPFVCDFLFTNDQSARLKAADLQEEQKV